MDNQRLQKGFPHGADHPPLSEQMQTPGVQLALDALVQQSRDLAPSDVHDFMDHLELLMRDCSQANIQAGKTWVVHHCQNPQQYDLLTRAMVAIAISRLAFIEKLHIVYLANDILSHSERKQQPWIKDTLFPHLVPLLRVAYYFPGVDDTQRQRVMKVLEIWRNKEYFPAHVMEAMEMNVRRPPLLPPPLAGGPPGSNPTPPPANPHGLPHQLPFHQHHQHRQHQYPHHPPPMHQQQYSPHLLQQQQYGQPNNTPSSPPQPIFHPQSPFLQQQQQQQLPYQQPPVPGGFYSMQPAPIQVSVQPPPLPPPPTHRDMLTRDLPAGLMISKIEADVDYYEPLPAYVSVPLQKNELKTESVLSSLKEFLSEDAATLETVTSVANIKDEGWHEGYLDEFYKKMAEKRKRAFSKDPQPRRSRQRNREVMENGRREDSRDMDRDRSFSRSRSRSISRSRSRSRSLSRSRRRSRSFSRSRSRSWSRSRSRSRTRSRSRSPYSHRGRSDSVDRSRGRKRDRRRSRTRSASGGRSKSRSRSRSRSRSKSPSRDVNKRRAISPMGRSAMEGAFPARSFAGLGSHPGHRSEPRQLQQQQPTRPIFQPARYG